MNCREFIIEFEERGNLSEPARFHLTVCTECQKTSVRQTQVWLMIEDFKPVAAPSDFDFHVKARIAQTKPSDFPKPVFLPILRYVLPLGFAVLLLGVFVFNSPYFSSAPPDFAQQSNSMPTIQTDLPTIPAFDNRLAFAPADNSKTVVEPLSIDKDSLVTTNVPKSTGNNQTTRIETADLQLNKLRRAKNRNEEGGGSRDTALTRSNTILPPGFNFNSNIANSPKIESMRPTDDKEILSITGIEFVLKNGTRTITAVQENSIAARSGVKIGDVIEKVSGNTLTIRRGTEKLEIILR